MNMEKRILSRFVPIYVNRYDMIPGQAERTIKEQIQRIKGLDLEFLVAKMNHRNPCVVEMFSLLTGIPTQKKEEVEAALPKLDNSQKLWRTCLEKGYMPQQNKGKWLMSKENGDTIMIPDKKTYRLCIAETIQCKILAQL